MTFDASNSTSTIVPAIHGWRWITLNDDGSVAHSEPVAAFDVTKTFATSRPREDPTYVVNAVGYDGTFKPTRLRALVDPQDFVHEVAVDPEVGAGETLESWRKRIIQEFREKLMEEFSEALKKGTWEHLPF
jgi:hypothetical protein